MLSKKTKYALKASIALARRYGQGPVLISEIARTERIPKKFLELILLELKNSRILDSKKGKGGGYFLSRPPEQITFGQVVRIAEGPLAPLPCVSQTAYRRCEECVDEQFCELRIVMKEVRDSTAKVLDHTNLKDALERSDQARLKGLDILNFEI